MTFRVAHWDTWDNSLTYSYARGIFLSILMASVVCLHFSMQEEVTKMQIIYNIMKADTQLGGYKAICNGITISKCHIDIPFSVCGTNSWNTQYFPILKIGEGWNVYWVIMFTSCIRFKKTSACFKVFVECMICFGELQEASSSFHTTPFNHEASPNTKSKGSSALTLWTSKTLVDLLVALIMY